MVPFLWGRGTDPDSAAIPYLTALGDLLGGGLLAVAFVLLPLAGQEEEAGSSNNVSDANNITSISQANLSVTSLTQSLSSTLAPALTTLAQDLNQAGQQGSS